MEPYHRLQLFLFNNKLSVTLLLKATLNFTFLVTFCLAKYIYTDCFSMAISIFSCKRTANICQEPQHYMHINLT